MIVGQNFLGPVASVSHRAHKFRSAGALLRATPKILAMISRALSEGGVHSAEAEAEQLVQFFGKMTRMDLYTESPELSQDQQEKLFEAVQKRTEGMPLAYVLGETEFYGYRFFVNEQVLVPRPETELLVSEALSLIGKNAQVLDLGTGSGCIAISLTLQRPDIKMSALDVSKGALDVARNNRNFHGLGKKMTLIESDLFSGLSHEGSQAFDMIVSNAPYIPSDQMEDLPREVLREPKEALDGGVEGLELIEKILVKAPGFLKKTGHVLLEIGHGQSERLAERLAGNPDYSEFYFVKDYNGMDRILIAKHG